MQIENEKSGMKRRMEDEEYVTQSILALLSSCLSTCLLVACAISAHYCCNQPDKGFTGHGDMRRHRIYGQRIYACFDFCTQTPCGAYQ